MAKRTQLNLTPEYDTDDGAKIAAPSVAGASTVAPPYLSVMHLLKPAAMLTRTESQESLFSRVAGDSDCDEPWPDSQSRVDGDIANAPSATPRDTAPKKFEVAGGVGSTYLARDDVGNVGFMFVNHGARASDAKTRRHQDMTLRKNPAQIIGMAECQKETEDVLSDPAVAGQKGVGKQHFESRDESAYICIRPDEDSSVLIGVRKSMAEKLELLDHERKDEGRYKTKNGFSQACVPS